MKKKKIIIIILLIILATVIAETIYVNKYHKSKSKENKIELEFEDEYNYTLNLIDVENDKFRIDDLHVEDLNQGARVYLTIVNKQNDKLLINKLLIKFIDKEENELTTIPVFDINLKKKESRLMMIDTDKDLKRCVRYEISISN